jgi:pyruvate kinase
MNPMKPEAFLFTKIIATLGPASSSVATIRNLIEEGVRVFRINFSHGTFEEYESYLKKVRTAEKQIGIYVGVMGDLSGPKIRIGKVVKDGVLLRKGQQVSFIKESIIGGEKDSELIFSSTYPHFIDEVRKGEKILIDDGNIQLTCTDKISLKNKKKLVCTVECGGLVTSSKGINLPDSVLSAPSMTEKDYACAAFAVKKGFDFLALSFVRSGKDVLELKQELIRLKARPENIGLKTSRSDLSGYFENAEKYIPVISKIEKPQAIDNLQSIINESDGIMVARGDLGVEMDLAEVAILQKKIARLCHENGKPVIVATQMLQSMIESPVPTRAEVSDVANAIFDGADAVMLSGETAVGKYPVETVRMMNRVAFKTNSYIQSGATSGGLYINKSAILYRTAALAHGVSTIVNDIKPRLIVTWTRSGGSSIFLSQQRLLVPIIAFGENETRLRQLSVLYSIKPAYLKQPASGSAFIRTVDKLLIKNKWADKGDPIIIVTGDPITKAGIVNRIVIHYVGESVE